MELQLLSVMDVDFHTIMSLYVAKFLKKKNIDPVLNFTLERNTDKFCLDHFRFTECQIIQLTAVLQLPAVIRTRVGNKVTNVEGLCLLLRRLAYPNRLIDLQLIFPRPKSVLSLILTSMIDFIYDNHSHLLVHVQHWTTAEHLDRLAAAVHNEGAPLTNCVGFIDGTFRPTCRPSRMQQEVYSGHKRLHGLKFQSVVLPNGLIASLFGPISGRRHDSFMLSSSNLLPQLEAHMPNHCLFGDSAYPLRLQLQGPYKGGHLTVQQLEFNKRMSMNRVVVEWVFGKLYTIGGLFINFHVCFNGSQTSSKFNLTPPTLHEYVNGIN